MDTITKAILGALAGIFAVCATVIFVLTENLAATVLFTGLATSALTGLAGISYGSRLSQPITSEVLETLKPLSTDPPPEIVQ
jgi:hypothetical protein